jgi:hypothetical protein
MPKRATSLQLLCCRWPLNKLTFVRGRPRSNNWLWMRTAQGIVCLQSLLIGIYSFQIHLIYEDTGLDGISEPVKSPLPATTLYDLRSHVDFVCTMFAWAICRVWSLEQTTSQALSRSFAGLASMTTVWLQCAVDATELQLPVD